MCLGCSCCLCVTNSATTHSDLWIRAKERNIEVQVIHNASIMNACSCCGLQLHLVRVRRAQDQAVQRLAEIDLAKLLQRSEADELVGLAYTSQTYREGIGAAHYASRQRMTLTSLLVFLLHLQQLINGLVAGHKARRQVHRSSLHELLEIGLLHLDI